MGVYLNDEQYDVANVECYKDSFIESDGKTIEFYIIDRLEDGSCKTEVENTKELTIENDFYFLGDEALDFEINGNTLTWRVSAGSTLTFKK